MTETGEFRTDHDAIISLVENVKWIRQHHEQFCQDNAEAHRQIRADMKEWGQLIVDRQHESRISTLEERTRWLKLIWFGSGIGGIGGAGGIYAAIRAIIGN